MPAWEMRSIFLNFLIPKLPSPREDDLSKGILDAIDMDSYRVEKKAVQKILLQDEDAEIEPVPTGGGGPRPRSRHGPALEHRQELQRPFRRHRVGGRRPRRATGHRDDPGARGRRHRLQECPEEFRHGRTPASSTTGRLERVMTSMMKDDNQLFKQFMDNDGFQRWLTDTVFELASEQAGAP